MWPLKSRSKSQQAPIFAIFMFTIKLAIIQYRLDFLIVPTRVLSGLSSHFALCRRINILLNQLESQAKNMQLTSTVAEINKSISWVSWLLFLSFIARILDLQPIEAFLFHFFSIIVILANLIMNGCVDRKQKTSCTRHKYYRRQYNYMGCVKNRNEACWKCNKPLVCCSDDCY